MRDLATWSGVPRPNRTAIEGRYARLEPLDPARHEHDLFQSAQAPGADVRFHYLFEATPPDGATFHSWIDAAAASNDPLFFAVIDKKSGRAEGRQALMRIDPVHGVIEIGNILWGPAIARSRVATEVLYLFATAVFDQWGYRRFEWKCNNDNAPSKRAALRFGFGFEGIFRNHMVVKGQNRDTAWFAMTENDWQSIKPRYEAWLAPDNFDAAGTQRSKLAADISR